MAKGYWIIQADVTDPDRYQNYAREDMPAIGAFAGRFLVRGAAAEMPEGAVRSRLVVLEFADPDAAAACYDSAAYRKAAEHRHGAADFDLTLIAGYDGAQPAPVGTPPAAAALPGYWIGFVDVRDMEGYKAYVAATPEVFGAHGAEFLVRGAAPDQREGKGTSRNVVIRFPSLAAAKACYHDPRYQAARALRLPHATGSIVIVEGYAGPQPE